MKRIACLILILTILITSFIPFAVAEESVDSRAYEIMKEFVSLHPYRKSGTEGERNAGKFIADFLKNVGYTVEHQHFTYNLYGDVLGLGELVEDENIVARLDSDSTKTVVIGAHYDNVFSTGEGQGAYDNGSGIGILLALAEYFADKALDYDLEIVAFGGEETGLYGSKHYVEYASASKKSNLLLYVNLDSILAGDELFMYCDEVKTYHEEYFANVAKELSLSVSTFPEYKGVAGVYMEGDKLPYTHTALQSDNASFFNDGIMTVSFSSFSLEREYVESVNESVRYDNVMHTEKDNLERICQLYGEEGKQKMETAYKLLESTLTRSDFVDQMIYAKKNNPSYDNLADGSLYKVISLIIIGALFVLLIIFYGVSYKKAERDIKNRIKKLPPPDIFSDF